MSVRTIVRLGHPTLRSPAAPLEPKRLAESEVQEAIDAMIETMRAAKGVGIAAPQVDLPWQLFVYEVREEDERSEGGIPLRVVVNPMITPQPGELVYDWEGCLSVPELRGLVPRHPAVTVRAVDRHGAPLEYLAEGFEARIIQHEHDHVNGVLYLDRMRDLRSLSYEEERRRYLSEHPVDGGSSTPG